jgi:hypothetical protein
MRITFHQVSTFCGICGRSLPGPAEHWVDHVQLKATFYCGRCRNLLDGRRKIKPSDIHRVQKAA